MRIYKRVESPPVADISTLLTVRKTYKRIGSRLRLLTVIPLSNQEEFTRELKDVFVSRDRVYIVGLGPGAPELMTLKAYAILRNADICLYTGSLLSPDLVRMIVELCPEHFDTSKLSVDEIVRIIVEGRRAGKLVAWFHDGCPTIYGGLWPIIRKLRELSIPYEIVPGVSSVNATAAALGVELTVPEISQTVIVTRISGRTRVPENESIRHLAGHGTLVLLLSVHDPDRLQSELMKAGLDPETEIAVVQYVAWRGREKILKCKLRELADVLRREHVTRCAVVIVGPCVSSNTWSTEVEEHVYSKTRISQLRKLHDD